MFMAAESVCRLNVEFQAVIRRLAARARLLTMRGNQHGKLTPRKIMDPLEETLVLIKPDALERGLAGEIIRRFETAGLRIRNARWVCPDLALVQRHYTDLQGKTRAPSTATRATSPGKTRSRLCWPP